MPFKSHFSGSQSYKASRMGLALVKTALLGSPGEPFLRRSYACVHVVLDFFISLLFSCVIDICETRGPSGTRASCSWCAV